MYADEFITEAATDELFHYMSTRSAVATLLNGYYSLESSTGMDVEERFAPKGKPWYLATTRSRVGDYTVRNAGTSGALFEIDGRWIGQRYTTKPLDYWGPEYHPERGTRWRDLEASSKRAMWQFDPNRSSESEDRIFSPTNTIPLRGSTVAIHVFTIPLDKIPGYRDPQFQGYRNAEIREIIRLGAQRDIPVYLYDDKSKWMTMRSKYRIDPNSQYARELLKGEPVPSYPPRIRSNEPYYKSMPIWIELMNKTPGEPLSKGAERLLSELYYYNDTIRSLQTDAHNAARNPESEDYQNLVLLNQYMRQQKLNNLKELQSHLQNKWREYREKTRT